jgi:hypothetical protein
MNDLLDVTGGLALAGAVAALLLIRSKDFVRHGPPQAPAAEAREPAVEVVSH